MSEISIDDERAEDEFEEDHADCEETVSHGS